MTQTESFKGDFFKNIWDHTLKMVRYSALIGVVYFMVIMAFMIAIFTQILNVDLEQYIALAQKPLENQMQLKEFYSSLGNQFIANWPLFLLIFLVMLFFQCYVYSLLVRTSSDVIKGLEPRVYSVFTNIDLKSVVNVFIAALCIIFIYMGLASIAILLSSIHALFSVAMFLFIFLLLVRFFAFLPGIVLAKLSVFDSLRYSLARITWNRAAKMILISIALGIGFFISLMFINSITLFLGNIGASLSMLINIAVQVFVLAGISALYTGLHYRYFYETEVLESEEE